MRGVSRFVGYGCALLSSALVAALLVALGVAHQQAPTTERTHPASSSSYYLCTGYAGCRNAGYSDAGYGAHSGTMYWRMYSGHNCTNYAAYRMVKAGMPNVRPWTGGGNASEWGLEMSRITDKKPAVGAIAWYARYSGGVGSAGHVAYVEKVISADEIIISEDSWSGDFHWQRITKDSGHWPSGFIHFIDKKSLANSAAPTIEGTPQVGAKLTADKGSWSPAPETISYQWQADGTPIDGADGASFTPTVAERGKTITVTVTAKKPDYAAATVTSAPTDKVTRGQFAMETAPTVAGDPMVDETLTVTPATWSPAPETTVYRWLADGKVITGADGPDLTLTRDMVGQTITAVTAARRDGYVNDPVRSEPVGPVAVGEIQVQQPYAVHGRTRVGEQLSITPGVVDPADATVAYQWLRDGVEVPGATGTTYDVTGDDLGARLKVRVTLTRRNYLTHVGHLVLDDRVTTRPTVELDAVGKNGRAVVGVRVTAPGLDVVDGQVVVTVAKQQQTVTLVDGRARVVVDDLAPGKRNVWVRYEGASFVEQARAQTTVRVLRAREIAGTTQRLR
ncbi:MAG TPA: CHAP domain-containing protein [Nocardioides sp.]|nr:CHAP domain-containing protein [Nocardioides sp.]